MIQAGTQLALLLHGGNGDWDEWALWLLAPVVIGGILWVTRRRDGEDAAEEPQPAESDRAARE